MASLSGHRTPWLGAPALRSERGQAVPPVTALWSRRLCLPPLTPRGPGCTPGSCHWDGMAGGPAWASLAGHAEMGGLGVRGLPQIAGGARC